MRCSFSGLISWLVLVEEIIITWRYANINVPNWNTEKKKIKDEKENARTPGEFPKVHQMHNCSTNITKANEAE